MKVLSQDRKVEWDFYAYMSIHQNQQYGDDDDNDDTKETSLEKRIRGILKCFALFNILKY